VSGVRSQERIRCSPVWTSSIRLAVTGSIHFVKSSAIRHLACSRSSSRIAAALFEKTVQVWDLQKREKISEFETVLSFGGKRLALDPSSEFCFAANWEKGRRGSVACYNAVNGELVWHRTDLSKTQHLQLSASSNTVWCVPDESSTKGLNATSGETLVEMRGLSDLFESPYSPCMLLVPRKRDYILRSRDEFRIPRLSFAVLKRGIHARCSMYLRGERPRSSL
jgi:hypothetical protein